MMDLLYICFDDRYRSKGLFDNTPTHAYDFKVKITDLEIFNANVFKSSYFPNHTRIGFIFDTTIDAGSNDISNTPTHASR